eukprot:8408171-Pyramimonas_sp.AAC.1
MGQAARWRSRRSAAAVVALHCRRIGRAGSRPPRSSRARPLRAQSNIAHRRTCRQAGAMITTRGQHRR